jgi:hypothetical protein
MRPVTTGLKWRPRKTGPDVPYWFADADAVKNGYRPKSENLKRYEHDAGLLVSRCEKLQTDLLVWRLGIKPAKPGFDGTFKALLELFQTDKKSPLHTHKPGTIKIYTLYLKQLIADHGNVAIDDTDGRMVMDWFGDWRSKKGRDQLSVGLMKLAILKAANSFGILCRMPGCIEFEAVLGKLEFESLPARTHAPTAQQIIAARQAAHAANAPLRALLYALQFETTARQWDFIGQWLPLSDKKPSAIIDRGKKWVGPMWSWIDKNLVLNMTPTKTEDTTAVEVWFDLSVCPMVMEELALIDPEKRVGPLIINERTGLPYRDTVFSMGWRRDFKAAGLPEKMWNRDFRAGGISEGGKAGVSRDDRKTVAGHAKEETTEGYERGTVSLEAHRRTMLKRVPFRSAVNASKT